MNVLFLHRNFPAQFRSLALHLAKDKANKVVYITHTENTPNFEGIVKVIYSLHRKVNPETHPYLRFTEESVLHAQGALRAALALKKQGFVPDVIIGNSWGPISFMKEAFPDAKLIAHIEWYYNTENSDIDFVKPAPIDTKARLRYNNSHLLVDLCMCDEAVTPTQWQLQQIPEVFHDKVSAVHEGIDTSYFTPDENATFTLNDKEFSSKDEVITYATRGMEPYRGFPQFMEAVYLLQKERPKAHIFIAGQDRVCYGAKLPDGKTFKSLMLEKYDFDMDRLHFTGSLPYGQYKKLLQISSAHVYLTYPFILSWSVLEAMSCGCVLLASDTQPVTEVVKDGHNGVLFDFFKPGEIVKKVCHVLDNKEKYASIRENARETIVENYDLPKMIKWWEDKIKC